MNFTLRGDYDRTSVDFLYHVNTCSDIEPPFLSSYVKKKKTLVTFISNAGHFTKGQPLMLNVLGWTRREDQAPERPEIKT